MHRSERPWRVGVSILRISYLRRFTANDQIADPVQQRIPISHQFCSDASLYTGLYISVTHLTVTLQLFVLAAKIKDGRRNSNR